MKNKFILLNLFVISFFNVKSQAQNRFGVKTNLQFTNVTNVHEDSKIRNFGLGIGFFSQVPMNDYNDRFFLRPELFYSQQGGEQNKDNHLIKFYQNYLNINLLLKYYFPDQIFMSRQGCACHMKTNHEFFIEAGPQFGYILSENNKYLDDLEFGGSTKLDLSLGIGAGISIRRKFEFSLRYNYGLTDTYRFYPKQNSTTNLAFSISYFFGREA